MSEDALSHRSAGFFDGARRGSLPLAQLEEPAPQLDPSRSTVVICAGGYRSSAAVSRLARRGFRELFNLGGGTSGWINAGYPVETPGASTASQQ